MRSVAVLALGLVLTLPAVASAQGAAGAGPEVTPVRVSLSGTLRAEGLRADGLLPGALVEVRQEGARRSVTSDASGTYRVSGLTPGRARISVYHLSTHHLGLELELPSTGEVRLDLELTPRALALPGIVARSHPDLRRPVGAHSPVAAELPVRTIAVDGTSGLVESGLAGIVRSLPSEDDSAADRVLFMRGSTVDARTVLLDGAPVLTPFHVAGLVAPFETELLGSANLLTAGAPARYDGGLSYLLDVDTRAPRPGVVRGSAAIDGLVARGSLDIPLPGGGGLLVGGRHLHGMQARITEGDARFPYAYDDLLLRWSLPVARGHHVHFTGFRNREGVHLDEVLLGRARAEWGNRVSSLRYTGRFGGVGVRATGASSRYLSSLPLGIEDPVIATGEAGQDRFSLDLSVPRDGWHMRAGLSAARLAYEYALDPRMALAEGPPRVVVVGGERAEVSTSTLGAWAEGEIPLDDRVALRLGTRVHRYSSEGGVRFAPRASVRLLLTEDAAFTIAAGRYHQPLPRPGLLGTERDAGFSELSWNPQLPVASATHLVLSLDQRLEDHLEVNVSGFAKTFENIDSNAGSRLFASGTDLRVARSGERFSGWVGYALSWFWEESSAASTGNLFSGRHLLSAGVRARLPGGIEAGFTAGYGAGLPLTSVAVTAVATEDGDLRAGGVRRLNTSGGESPPLDLPGEDDFLRLDLEISREMAPRFMGRSSELRPYLRVLNALDRRDALFHYFDRWREGEMRPVANRPLMPLIGVEWRF